MIEVKRERTNILRNMRPKLDGCAPMQKFFLFWLFAISLAHAFTPLKPFTCSDRSQNHVQNQQILRPLSAIAKSGGKMILTDEMYAESVLSKNNSKPVLVFFSAPWYVS